MRECGRNLELDKVLRRVYILAVCTKSGDLSAHLEERT